MKIKNTYKVDDNFSKATINEISREHEEKVALAYESITDEKFLEKICKETREMIPQIDERIHYWENRRTLFLQISLGITAASLAGFIAIASKVDNILLNFYTTSTFIIIPILVLCLSLIIGGVMILSLWNEQNNPTYPFTKATKTWRWQYRHAETNPNRTDFEKFTKEIVEEEAHKFAANLTDYKIHLIKSSYIELLDQDISQLYLLIINEKFKIKFVSQLRDKLYNVLRIALYITLFTILILAIIFLIYFTSKNVH
jgi:hypothetical protein